MSTPVTIGSGRDYADLATFLAWVSSSYGNVLTGTEDGIHAIVYDSETWTSAMSIPAMTGDATHRLIIEADPENSWRGKWLAGNVTLTQNGTSIPNAIELNAYVTLRGFQVEMGSGGEYYFGIRASAYTAIVDRCHSKDLSKSGIRRRGIGVYSNGGGLCVNSVASDFSSWQSCGLYVSSYNSPARFVNCTSFGNYWGSDRSSSPTAVMVMINCILNGNTNADYNTAYAISADSKNCVFSGATAPAGTGHIVSTTVEFVDAANLDFHLTADNAAIIDLGYDTSSETWAVLTDCDGETRSTTPDPGVDEYIVVSSGPIARIRMGGVWVPATPKIKIGGVWVPVTRRTRSGGSWQ